MIPDRVRWTDSRLDDRFKAIDEELRDLRSVPENIAASREQMRQLRRDMDDCTAAVKQHRTDFAAYVSEQNRDFARYVSDQAKVTETHRLERKSDRRWMVGTVLSSAALVIAAVGILLGYLS